MEIVPKKLEAYAEAHTEPLPPLLAELMRETSKKFGELDMMLTGQLEGQYLQALVGMTGAKRVLEIGTFTGFSAQMMAAALPADGELITLELSQEHADFAQSFIDRSEHGKKIRIIVGPAIESLKGLRGPFDFAFIDADKVGYEAYYEATLPIMSDRGIIAVDNVLRDGKVLDPQDEGDRAIVAFNDHVMRDKRVIAVMTTVRDGVTLIRKR